MISARSNLYVASNCVYENNMLIKNYSTNMINKWSMEDVIYDGDKCRK